MASQAHKAPGLLACSRGKYRVCYSLKRFYFIIFLLFCQCFLQKKPKKDDFGVVRKKNGRKPIYKFPETVYNIV